MKNEKVLRLYGADWCMKSANLRNYLQSKWIDFEDYNVETDTDAEARVRALYDGALKFPTITYGDAFLKNPGISELNAFLASHKIV